jgi:DNA repair protein RecO
MSRTSATSPALVLHVRDLKEADRLVTVLTPEFGRMTLSAKGVRKLKSRRAAALNPGNIIRCSWITSGEWHTLTEVMNKESLLGTGANLERMRDFSGLLEMMYHLSLEGMEQSDLYDQAVRLLREVGQKEAYNRGWVRQQLLELAAEHGFMEEAESHGQSVTKVLEAALERPLRSFSFLTVE